MKMQIWYRLTAWYWRITQKTFLFLAVLMTIMEAAAVCVTAGRRSAAAVPYDDIFMASCAWLAFTIAFFAVMGTSLRPTLVAQGKTKAGYTLATLPGGGACALFAQMANTALSLLLLSAWQVVLTIALGFAAIPINRAATLQSLPQYVMPAVDFQLSLVRNLLIRLLVPTSLSGVICLALLLLAPSVLLAGALFQRGIGRLCAVVLGLAGAFGCLMLVPQQVMGVDIVLWQINWPFVVLPVLMAISVVWSLRSVRRASWL